MIKAWCLVETCFWSFVHSLSFCLDWRCLRLKHTQPQVKFIHVIIPCFHCAMYWRNRTLAKKIIITLFEFLEFNIVDSNYINKMIKAWCLVETCFWSFVHSLSFCLDWRCLRLKHTQPQVKFIHVIIPCFHCAMYWRNRTLAKKIIITLNKVW